MNGGLQFTERACFLESRDTLVIADLHLGLEATSALTMPVGERQTILGRVEQLLGRFDPERVLLAGDVLHAFETVPRGVSETLTELRHSVSTAGASLELVAGNHDTHLDDLGLGLPIADHRRLEGTIVCHGHEQPAATAQRYLIGHEHPTIEIEGQRHPCALVGPGVDSDSEVVVLPAFTPLARGTPVNDLREGDTLSPLLADPGAFRPIVAHGGEVRRFPSLRELRPHL